MTTRFPLIAFILLYPLLSATSAQQAPPLAGPSDPTARLDSRLRTAEIYFGGDELESAEKALLELLHEPALPAKLRSDAETLLGKVVGAKKARKHDAELISRLRLSVAESLAGEGEYSQARQLAAGVLEKADSLPLAQDAARVYKATEPSLPQQASARLQDISKWEWLLYAVPIVIALASIWLVRRVFWILGPALFWVRWLLGRPRRWVLKQEPALKIGLLAAGSVLVAVLVLASIGCWLLVPGGHVSPFWATALTSVAILAVLAAVLGSRPAPIWIRQFDDPGKSDAQTLLRAAFSQWSTQKDESTSGLLIAEASVVPAIPEIQLDSVDILPDLSALPAVGGVSPGAIASAFQSVLRWFWSPYPSLTGSAHVDDDAVTIRLTWQQSAGIIIGVSSTVPAKTGDALEKAVKAASYQMLFVIQDGSSQASASAANSLREGLDHLNEYLNGSKHEALDLALDVFSSVRAKLDPRKKNQLAQAHLYEGIARDLNEQHERAISHFDLARELAPDESTQTRAVYNKAVSQLRSRYQLDSLQSSIQTLRDYGLIPPLGRPFDAVEASKQPIRAFGYALMAHALAHCPIYWNRTPTQIGPNTTYLETLAENRTRIVGWVHQVETITGELTTLDTADNAIWNEKTRTQLKWMIANARGNAYLNSIRYLKIPPDPAQQQDRPALRTQYLEGADVAFRQCEVLLPPGVETLSNIGTLLLTKGKRVQAREYFERAIKLNPAYEYAYYRIAQSWDEEKWREKVVETLNRYKLPPGIPEFQEMYQESYVQPAQG
jgi:TPR repeat protein